MQYQYRCPVCGLETVRQQSIMEPIPATIRQRHADLRVSLRPTGGLTDATAEYAVCGETELRRLWEAPRVNLGYRASVHSENEHFQFKHL